MDLGLTGKAIIVTGGGSGIGAGICEVLSEEGARPIILSRSAPDGGWLDKINGVFEQVELSDDEACERAVTSARRRVGDIYGLVNNAGANDGVGLDDTSADFRRSLDQNLVHYFTMVRLVQNDLRQNKGAIVNIASKTAVTGQGGTSAYVAAKAAQLGLTREWAVDFLKDSVRVNAIVVAEVLTPLYERWLNSFENAEVKLDQIAKTIPLENRMTTVREIGDLCAFLLSNRASHMTGQHLYPDGGYVHLDRTIS